MDREAVRLRMDQMIYGFWISQAIYVAAKLNVADALESGPKDINSLAAEVGADSRSLHRLLRTLSSFDVFREEAKGAFSLTPLAETLCTKAPNSKRSIALLCGEEFYRASADLLYSVQTGESAFYKQHKMPVFEFLSHHPEKSAILDDAMVGYHGHENEAVANAYDFSAAGALADIGGGNGSLISAILKKFPGLKGITYDLPDVSSRAEEAIASAGLADRCQAAGGDFFESVPAGADIYILRHVIHDWDDERSIAILRNCREAMGQDARILVAETIMPEGNEPAPVKVLDMPMLAVLGGMERTEEEYRELFDAAGLEFTRVVSAEGAISLMEGKRK